MTSATNSLTLLISKRGHSSRVVMFFQLIALKNSSNLKVSRIALFWYVQFAKLNSISRKWWHVNRYTNCNLMIKNLKAYFIQPWCFRNPKWFVLTKYMKSNLWQIVSAANVMIFFAKNALKFTIFCCFKVKKRWTRRKKARRTTNILFIK